MEATTSMKSDYDDINKFYNSNIRTSTRSILDISGNYYSKMIFYAQTPERVVFILDSLIQLEIDHIMQLPFTLNIENEQQERKEKKIREYLINEVQTFYGSIFLGGMLLKQDQQIRQLSKDSTSSLDIYNREWEELIESFFVILYQLYSKAPLTI